MEKTTKISVVYNDFFTETYELNDQEREICLWKWRNKNLIFTLKESFF